MRSLADELTDGRSGSQARTTDLSSGDAASQTPAQLVSWKEEQKRKEKEAKEMASSYRSAGLSSGNAQERVAAELKHQKDEQLRKKKEAQQLLVGSSGD